MSRIQHQPTSICVALVFQGILEVTTSNPWPQREFGHSWHSTPRWRQWTVWSLTSWPHRVLLPECPCGVPQRRVRVWVPIVTPINVFLSRKAWFNVSLTAASVDQPRSRLKPADFVEYSACFRALVVVCTNLTYILHPDAQTTRVRDQLPCKGMV